MLLADQDRTRWDRALIAEGQDIVRRCLRRGQPGPYQIQAAINAVHSDAPTPAPPTGIRSCSCTTSSWPSRPSPVVALNRAVAVAEVEGPAAALALVDGLDLGRYYLFHADPRRPAAAPGPLGEAVGAYETALALTGNAAERAYLAAAWTASRTP